MENKLSKLADFMVKMTQKCFCLQMSRSNIESLDGKNDQNVFQ